MHSLIPRPPWRSHSQILKQGINSYPISGLTSFRVLRHLGSIESVMSSFTLEFHPCFKLVISVKKCSQFRGACEHVNFISATSTRHTHTHTHVSVVVKNGSCMSGRLCTYNTGLISVSNTNRRIQKKNSKGQWIFSRERATEVGNLGGSSQKQENSKKQQETVTYSRNLPALMDVQFQTID